MTLLSMHKRPNQVSFNNLMSDFFPEFPSLFKEENASLNRYSVPVNVHENEGSFELEVIAPGFDKGDFKLNLEKNLLTISAEKKAENETGGKKEIRKEYRYGSFKRSFTVSNEIDAEQIGARYVNGVLTVTLPKKAEAKVSPKEISIQ